jgi:uncharacterized surface protein with fasciclin (FAS1) repeats
MPAQLTAVRGPARIIAAGLAASGLAAAAAACGSSAPAAAPASSRPAASHSASMTEHAMTIGTDCRMLPESGMGSMHGMAAEPAVTAARHNPLITTLAAEVGKAHLTATLNSARSITIFAPDNQAFKKLTAHDMTMMSGPGELARILKYHVVRGRVTPAQLAHGATLTTLEGSQLKTARMGSTYEAGKAAITCGNLHAANATIYVINMVLMPMH